MNNQSFERQLQQVEAPAPDPAARVRARQAAVEEFTRVHVPQPPRPARTHRIPTFWLGGFATACVAIVGVSVILLMPEHERVVAPQMTTRQEPQALKESREAELVAGNVNLEPAPAAGAGKPSAQARSKAAPSPATPENVPPLMVDMPAPPVPAPRAAAVEAPPTALVVQAPQTAPPMPPAPPVPPLSPLATGQAAASRSSAQDVLQEVQVSGSRIQRPGTTAANPVAVVTAEEMRRLGIVNVEDALTQLTPRNTSAAATPAAAPQSDHSAAFIGETVANLRGMDPAFGSRTLTLVDGRRVVVLPTTPAAGGDTFAHFEVNPVKRTADEPVSTFSADVDTASYSFVRRQLNSGVLPQADAVRTEEMINYFDYAWPAATSRDQPFRPTVTVSDSPWNEGRKLVHIGIKGYELPARQNGVYLSVLGFGQGNYRDETAQTLAQNGNGVAAYIDTLNEARKVLVEQANAQLFTIARDVKLQVEFNPDTVAEYRLVGYETRALNREDFNNDKVDAGDVGAGHVVTAIYEITPVGAPGLVDERRYGNDSKVATPRGNPDVAKAGEYGYLKIRYKLPGQDSSRLIEQPIGVKAGVPAALKQDVQFATAVAGFAQLLQGGRYTGSLSYEDVLNEAEDGVGRDANGYRNEFLQLVRRADKLPPQKPLF